jgi:hypothetical protein
MGCAAVETASRVNAHDAVDEIRGRIAAIVTHRQQLRTSGATPLSLERNRLELAASHRELSQALINLHLRPLAAA